MPYASLEEMMKAIEKENEVRCRMELENTEADNKIFDNRLRKKTERII